MRDNSFSAALVELKAGKRMARVGWNGRGMHIEIQAAQGLQPFIVFKTAQGKRVPWVASQTDLLADDWVVVEDDARDP